MNTGFKKQKSFLAVLLLILPILACSLSSQSTPTTPDSPALHSSPTPTPTPIPPELEPPTPEAPTSRCAGLSGEIEMRVLVGPSEAVGLEPHAVGSIPFEVTSNQEPFLLQGSGPITYSDILVEEWGTYEVSMDLQTAITGECVAGESGESLELNLQMTGEQMVEVDAEGFHGEYPWAGESSIDVSFPLEEGATAEGEGWLLVLHLANR